MELQSKQNQQEQQFKIPETISEQKKKILIKKLISTCIGIDELVYSSYVNIGLLVILITVFFVFTFIKLQYPIFIGVYCGLALIIAIIFNCFNKQKHTIHHYFFAILFAYLWSHQLSYTKQIQLIVLSLISFTLSLSSILLYPIQQISSPTLYVKQFHFHSTRYVRILLPLPLFIITLILDYGNFLKEQTNHLYYIRLAISLIFITWIFGWISTIYNTFFFFFNNFNRFLFGDESKSILSHSILCFFLNSIPIAIYLGFAENQYLPYWILWLGSSLTSILSFLFIRFILKNQVFNQKKNTLYRTYITIITQILILGALLSILLTCSFDINAIKIILIIDLIIYLLFSFLKFLSLPRNWLGCKINLQIFNNQFVRFIQRISLRIISGLVVIIVTLVLNQQSLYYQISNNFDVQVDLKYVQYFFIPFLVYRSYKRSISHSITFSFHVSLAISLYLITQGLNLEGILSILFFPPLPQNFLMVFLSPYLTPPKLKQKKQFIYSLFYFSINCLTVLIFVLSIGMLQFSMLFGLPLFLNVIQSINQGSKIKSKQNSLYQKIIEYLPNQLFKFQPQGHYLLRISKYIMLVEIKQQLYGFGQIIDLKGLEVQQVTSCHSKQGQTIDKIVQETWRDNVQCINFHHLFTVLTPFKKTSINVPTQNQIQLTGIIQSKQFIQLFKIGFMKALCLQIFKINYNENQLTEGEQIISDFSAICKKDKFQLIFCHDFAKKINLEIVYPQTSNNVGAIGKKKLPPIKNGNAPLVNDFMDLLQSPNVKPSVLKEQTSSHHLLSTSKEKGQMKQSQKKIQKVNKKQLNLALIMSLYHYCVGKFDYFNVKKFYDLLKKQKDQIIQVKFQNSTNIIFNAISSAFKIAIDKVIIAQTQIQVQDFQEYQKSSFLGIAGTQQFNYAVSKDVTDIWTVNYTKGAISIKRLAKSQNQLYMFKADSFIIRSIWNNLRFQLMYATNDNDQRYSIQTHPYLMRNLWTEACQQPFGYPGYHSGSLINN